MATSGDLQLFPVLLEEEENSSKGGNSNAQKRPITANAAKVVIGDADGEELMFTAIQKRREGVGGDCREEGSNRDSNGADRRDEEG